MSMDFFKEYIQIAKRYMENMPEMTNLQSTKFEPIVSYHHIPPSKNGYLTKRKIKSGDREYLHIGAGNVN